MSTGGDSTCLWIHHHVQNPGFPVRHQVAQHKKKKVDASESAWPTSALPYLQKSILDSFLWVQGARHVDRDCASGKSGEAQNEEGLRQAEPQLSAVGASEKGNIL